MLSVEDLNIDQLTLELLSKKKIYFTFSYIGSVRAYKHNQLIWEFSSENEQELLEKAGKCIDFFRAGGYIG